MESHEEKIQEMISKVNERLSLPLQEQALNPYVLEQGDGGQGKGQAAHQADGGPTEGER